MTREPKGILRGPRSVQAYVLFAGVETADELEEEQLTLDLAAVFTSSSTRTAKSPSTSCSRRSRQPRKPAASGAR